MFVLLRTSNLAPQLEADTDPGHPTRLRFSFQDQQIRGASKETAILRNPKMNSMQGGSRAHSPRAAVPTEPLPNPYSR